LTAQSLHYSIANVITNVLELTTPKGEIMKAKFSLVAYVSGKRITLDTSKKNLQPPVGATKFYLRYTDENGKRHDDALGDDFAYAWAEIRTREARQEYEQKTGEKLPEKKTEVTPVKPKGTPVTVAIRDWLEQKRITPGIAQSTVNLYGFGLAKFEEFAKGRIANVEGITKEDLFRFATYLREERERKLGPRTVSNYFAYMIIFLKGLGIHLHIPVRQYGKPPKRKPQAYTQEQLDALFLVATAEESLLFKSYLFSGMRNKELAHLTYADINFKHSIWTVQPKDDWRVKSKDSVRAVPVPPFHTKDIQERMILGHRSGDDLVFPNDHGKVHNWNLTILKKLSKRAGVVGRVDIHKFRSTCATMWLRDRVDVLEVARRLGHGDLKTVQQYIEMVNLESNETMEQTTKTFARFGTIRS
jgi:integrase